MADLTPEQREERIAEIRTAVEYALRIIGGDPQPTELAIRDLLAEVDRLRAELADVTRERDEARAALAAYELKPGEVLVRVPLVEERSASPWIWIRVPCPGRGDLETTIPRSAIVAGLPRDAAGGKGGDGG